MSGADILLLLLVAAGLFFALRGALRGGKNGGCGGSCAQCRGCKERNGKSNGNNL